MTRPKSFSSSLSTSDKSSSRPSLNPFAEGSSRRRSPIQTHKSTSTESDASRTSPRTTHTPARKTTPHFNTTHSLDLTTPLEEFVSPHVYTLYKRLFGETVLDALCHFPSSVIESKQCDYLTPEIVGSQVHAFVEPIMHIPARTPSAPYRIVCKLIPKNTSPSDIPSDTPDTLELVFFYKRIQTNFLRFAFPVGHIKRVSGKIELFADTYKMIHPLTGSKTQITSDSTDEESATKDHIIYPQISGLSSERIRPFIEHLLKHIPELPEWHTSMHDYPGFIESIAHIHQSKTSFDLNDMHTPARKRLLHDELLAQQVALLLTRQQTKRLSGIAIDKHSHVAQTIRNHLPFQLTQGQEDALAMIEDDMASGEPMLRLLQGDVGCGKTIVAALSASNVLAQGHQVAILAPTDILSTQHFATFSKLFENTPYRIELLTGKVLGKKRKSILEDLVAGKIHILVGTHALIQQHVIFQKLAMVIVDEQHRFGVEQRSQLMEKGVIPHLLSMTATPIPRTLQMALCGDLDVTSILEKPMGRKAIQTSLHSVNRIDEITHYLQQNLSKTNQAYWVCPLIEESSTLEFTAVTERFATLKHIFGDRVGLLHGRMKAHEKDDVMRRFQLGELYLLISTTVIEVGVDVKTANIMIIEHAERFGLSQLHQLRGRVGRSDVQARCLLLYEKLTVIAKERLGAMRDSCDGFYLAEMDLKIRGAGDMFGLNQSGQQVFRFYQGNDPKHFHSVLKLAHQDAVEVLRDDPMLTSERGRAVQKLLHVFDKENILNILRSG